MIADKRRQLVIYLIMLLLSIVGVMIGMFNQMGWLSNISLVIFFLCIFTLIPMAFYRNSNNKKMDQKLRYRIHHRELETKSFSSRTVRIEKNHPLEELFAIDYVNSNSTNRIEASLEEVSFIYQELTVFPKKKIPIQNPFIGFMLELEVNKTIPDQFIRNHEYMMELYDISYIAVKDSKLRFYIPNVRFLEDALENKEYEEQLTMLTMSIKRLIKLKNEIERTLEVNA